MNQEVLFNARMTILFGENASGKTGYVRIFKRMVGVRAAERILPDIKAATSPATPQATMGYTLGGSAMEHQWRNEAGVPPFTRISVFDARAVSFHVDEDLTYTYTPGDLGLFRFTHQAVEATKTRLEAARDAAQPKGNSFLAQFRRDTPLYAKIEALGPSTNFGELETLAAVTEDELATLETIRETVAALEPQTVQARLRLAREDRDLYVSVLSVARAIATFPWGDYDAAVERVRRAAERQEYAAEQAFAQEGLPGGLGTAWRAFIQASEEYIKDLSEHDYPHDDAQCLYCRQNLGPAALQLVRKYRDYSNSTHRQELDAAIRELSAQSTRITALDFGGLGSSLRRRLAGEERREEVVEKALGLIDASTPLQEQVRQGRPVNPGDTPILAGQTESAALLSMARAEELIAALEAQAAERERERTQETAKLRELEARLALRALLPEIRAYVERAKWASRALTLIASRFPQLLRSLTEVAKEASEGLLNRDFEHHFMEECAALQAPHVKLDFPGRKGQPARRKSLSADYRLSDILSEGEQKVIALADFLAEASLPKASAPIIFDDPVTSLDHQRLGYVVDRLTHLSKRNQLIVFTHDIWFAVELLARFEDEPGACTYYEVSSASGVKGLITERTHPRWDTPGKIGPRINTNIDQAGKAAGDSRDALIERGYSLIRTWCEAVAEQELLAGVTQRYQAQVRMTKLPQIKAERLGETISVILPVFEKACRLTDAHSQPLVTLGVRPTLEELKADWKTISEARDKYRK